MKSRKDLAVVNWLFLGCLLIFLMVAIGGITRLTDSGLSIVEWDVIMGIVPPLNQQEWQEAFEEYKRFPEYQKVNYRFELSDFKSIFWWEYIHRALGRVIGLAFLFPFLYFWISGRISKRLMPKLILIFLLGALQGFIGWYMVKSGLVDRPSVSHYRLALHLVVAFGTFGFVFWVALDELLGSRKTTTPAAGLLRWTWVFFALLCLQIVYGAFVAGLRAGYVYTTWPKMGDAWIAEAVTAMEPFYLNFLENLAGVQFVHRYVAVALVVIAVVVWIRARKAALPQGQAIGANLVSGMTILQAALGVFTLIYATPLALALVHQIGAFFLLAFTLFFIHRLKKG